MLVAAESYGQIYFSMDSGVNWWNDWDGIGSWVSVASSVDGDKLIAAPMSGPIYISSDLGVNFSPTGSSLKWKDGASSADGTKTLRLVPSRTRYIPVATRVRIGRPGLGQGRNGPQWRPHPMAHAGIDAGHQAGHNRE